MKGRLFFNSMSSFHNQEYMLHQLDIHPTQMCDKKCVHCFSGAGLAFDNELSQEMATKCFNESLPLGLKNLVITGGGEPLLRKNFVYHLVDLAKRNGVHSRLCTSGSLLSHDVSLKLQQLGINLVQISLDDPDELIHDEFRGVPGTYKKAIEAMNRLSLLGVEFSIRTTLTAKNSKKMPRLIELCENVGASKLVVAPLRSIGRGAYAEQWSPKDEDVSIAVSYLLKQSGSKWAQSPQNTESYLTKIIEENPRTSLGNCRCGISKLVLGADYSLRICDYSSYSVGNAVTSDLKPIWQNNSEIICARKMENCLARCTGCDAFWKLEIKF